MYYTVEYTLQVHTLQGQTILDRGSETYIHKKTGMYKVPYNLIFFPIPIFMNLDQGTLMTTWSSFSKTLRLGSFMEASRPWFQPR